MNDINSEYFTDIISNKPGFLIRWGMVIFLAVFIFLGCICWFVKYPDTIDANAKLVSLNAPKEVITKRNGTLTKLLAHEGDVVNQGDILGYIESTATHEEVLQVSSSIDSLLKCINADHLGQISSLYHAMQYNHLGELQMQYQTFMQNFITFRNYIKNGFWVQKKVLLDKDVSTLEKLHANLLLQQKLTEQDLALAQSTFHANELLKRDSVISDFDYRNEQSRLIGKQLSLPQVNSAVINNESQQNDKQKEILQLNSDILQQKGIFIQALQAFQSQINEWKQNYLLIAPSNGTVAFASFMQEKQQLTSGQTVCFVNPDNAQYYAELYIPQSNFGKVKKGQRVLLKLPSYPFQEYGSITGNLDFISNISTDSGYAAKVVLPRGLHTNHNKKIQFRDGLAAQGEIITQNMNLLERMYYNLVKSVKQ